jgi:hypothetical protein
MREWRTGRPRGIRDDIVRLHAHKHGPRVRYHDDASGDLHHLDDHDHSSRD